MSSRVWAAQLAGLFSIYAHATTFASISADPSSFVPDQFSSLTDSPGSVSFIATLGDGSLAFNGGLTVGSGNALYSIANDSLGNGSLYTLESDGILTLVGVAGGLGQGFLGGLAWDSANSTFYAAVLDTSGNTTLDSITAGGVSASTGLALGTGFSGLTYDSANGLFYGIGNDDTGFSTLYSFALGGPVNTVGGLGFGFGALTYDASNNLFWAIDPVNNSGSQLFQITPAGVVSSPFYTLGDGFAELAVTSAEVSGVAEPGTLACVGTGLMVAVIFLRRKIHSERRIAMRLHFPLLSLAAALTCGGLHASVIYNLRDGRYFPDGSGSPFNTTQSGAFNATTSDSLQVSFSSNPGNPLADTFDGLSSVGTGPFKLGTSNAVTIETATTTFSNLGIYSIVESGIQDTSVTITGGSGTGYLLPTFHVVGTMGDSNPNADVGDLICAGNSACLLSSIFGTTTSSLHSVDGFYTPAIGSETSFQFGTPFGFFFFFGSGIQEFNSLNPGGTTMANLTLQLVGIQVVDANGTPIPGAQIHSPFLDAVNAPEPGTVWTGLAALAILGIFAARKTTAGLCKGGSTL